MDESADVSYLVRRVNVAVLRRQITPVRRSCLCAGDGRRRTRAGEERSMSTRSQLRFVHQNESAAEQDSTNRIAQVYRHSDGYPESVLRDLAQLKHLLEKTRTERGPSYAAAQFIGGTGAIPRRSRRGYAPSLGAETPFGCII